MYHAEHRHGAEIVEIKSSLSLQVLMYYQGFYSLLYCTVSGGCLLNKTYNYEYRNAILELLTLPIFLLWAVTEVARVSLGYVGNIQENVPMISAFLLLTVFPQLVAVAFFSFLQDPAFPFDSAAGCIMLVFLLLELVIGKRTLNALITTQTAHFKRLCQQQELLRMRDIVAPISSDPPAQTMLPETHDDSKPPSPRSDSKPPSPRPPSSASSRDTHSSLGLKRRTRPWYAEGKHEEKESLLARKPVASDNSDDDSDSDSDDVTNPLVQGG